MHPGTSASSAPPPPVSTYLRKEASGNSQRIQREQLSAGETCRGYRAWEEVEGLSAGAKEGPVTELLSVVSHCHPRS